MGTLSVQPPSGATRSLSEIFILLRNNAVQSRHIFAESVGGGRRGEDRLSLVPLNDEHGDVESGISSRIPPEWVNMVDEVQYEMSRIRTRLKELRDMEAKHLSRPSFNDDASTEEKAIEAATTEITKMMSHSQRLIAHIKNSGTSGRRTEELLQRNVTTALIAALQGLTVDLRGTQSSYCRQLQSREENVQQYFGSDAGPSTDLLGSSVDFAAADEEAARRGEEPAERTMAQLQALEDNTSMVKEREREILVVSKSILELNTLFKDLAGFVVEQGTVLDRIDFNIEQSTMRVSSALKSVKKAENYQAANRKMMCIVCLSGTIIVLLFILIGKKMLLG